MNSFKCMLKKELKGIMVVAISVVMLIMFVVFSMYGRLEKKHMNTQAEGIETFDYSYGWSEYIDPVENAPYGTIFMDEVSRSNIIVTFLMCIASIVLGAALFYHDKEKKTGEFVAALPVKKTKVLIAKLLAGAIVILGSLFIYLNLLFILREINIGWINERNMVLPYYDILEKIQSPLNIANTVLLVALIVLMIFAITMLVQVLITNSVFAAFMSGFLCLLPVIFSTTENFFIKNGVNLPSFSDGSIIKEIDVPLFSVENAYTDTETIIGDANVFCFSDDLALYILGAIGVVTVLVVLTAFANKKYELSMKGKVIWIRPVKYLFEILFGLAVSTAVIELNFVSNMSITAVMVLMALVAVVVAIVFNKILSRYTS